MNTSEEKIALIIEAYNKTKGAFTELGNSLKGVDDETKKIQSSNKSMFDAMKENWVAISVAVYEVKKVISEAWEYMEKGAKDQQAAASFHQVAASIGEDAEHILEEMKRVSNGTIEDADIMQRSVKGMMQGLSGDQLINIMEMARSSARIAGTDVKTAFEDIVTAVGNKTGRSAQELVKYHLVTREQVKLLDANLAAGIRTVDLYKIVMANAAENTKVFGGAQEDNAEKMQQWRVTLEEMKGGIGSGIFSFFKMIKDWAIGAAEIVEGLFAKAVTGILKLVAEARDGAAKLPLIGNIIDPEKTAELRGQIQKGKELSDKLFDSAGRRFRGEPPITKPTTTANSAAANNKGNDINNQLRASQLIKEREAQIEKQIADLDIGEKERSISHREAAQKRVELTKQLLDTQIAYGAEIDNEANPAAWATQQKTIDDTKRKLSDLGLALREFNGDFQTGFKEGLLRYIDMVGGAFKQAVELAQATAQAMQQAFSDFFFDIMTNKLKNFSDYIKGFLESIARAIANMMAQRAAAGIASGIAGMFPTGGDNITSGGVRSAAPPHHSGGMIFHKGGYVPRFHFGGLMPDERPAILQTGEGVLSRRGMAALDALNGGQAGGGNTNVTIEVVNKSSQAVKATQGPMKFDLRGTVVSVILEDLEGNGPLRHAFSGVK